MIDKKRSSLPAGPLLHYHALDGLRGLLALAVAIFHFTAPRHWLSGAPAVDVFFILSGIVLMESYHRRLQGGEMSWLQFACIRLARLWPLHLAALLLVSGLWVGRALYLSLHHPDGLAFGFGEMFPASYYRDGVLRSWLLQAFMLNGVGLIDTGQYWNGPSWSISSEFWSNVLMFALLPRLPWRSAVTLLCAVVVASWAVLVIGHPNLDQHVHRTIGGLPGSMVRAHLGLSLGMLCWMAMRRYGMSLRSSVWLDGLQCITFVLLMAHLYRPMADGVWSFFVPLTGVVLCGTLMPGKGVIHDLLCLGAVQHLGRVSFALYVLHYPVQYLFQTYARWVSAKPSGLVLFCVACVVVATVAHRRLELPASAAMRRWLLALISR